MVSKEQIFATSSLTILMGLTGVGVFLWMAALSWADITGVGVGVIFIVLGVGQTLFSIIWTRAIRNQELKENYSATDETAQQEMTDMIKKPLDSTAAATKA